MTRAAGLAVAIGLIAAVGAGGGVGAAPCWRPPVAGVVVDPFRAPACRWCAGNRGIEYEVGSDSAVSAAATGTVAFVGVVAGIRYVVVELPGGWRHTYGRLASADVEVGDVVVAGTEIARTTTEFLFGLRIGGEYADPAPYVGRSVGRARLIPTDGSAARPAPPARVRCRVASSGR